MVKLAIRVAASFTSSTTRAGPFTLRARVLSSTFHTSSSAFKPPLFASFTQTRHCSAEARGSMAPPTDRDILPDAIKPTNYNLSLYNLEFGGSWAYDGLVKIDSKVKSSTQEVVLNVKELDVVSAEVLDRDGGSPVATMTDVSYDKSSERATIKLDKALSTGDAVVSIKFKGTMNSAMSGFYRAKYKPVETPAKGTPTDGEHHYMFSTQFEPCDARRAFPCFDEPNLKASFEFDIEIPDDLVAVSNMPEKASSKAHKEGLKTVSFERTPPMSTYLAAWAVGDFEYVEAFTERKYNGKNIPVRVYTTRGLKDQGQFALEHAHKTLDYFSEIFGIEYPLPTSDLLAVHVSSLHYRCRSPPGKNH